MDYKLDKILVIEEDKVDQDFFCGICNNIMFKNFQCSNGHIFCSSCIGLIQKKNNQCAECRVDLTVISANRYLERQINKLNVFCPNKFHDTIDYVQDNEYGCQNECSINDLESHLKECKFGFVKCPNNEDCDLVRKYLLEEHLLSCDKKKVECEYCKELVIKANLNRHYHTLCPKYMVNCKCGIKIKRELIKLHKINECPSEMVECIYSKVGGCKKKVTRSDMNQHLSESSHHQTIINSIASIKDELLLTQKALNLCATKYSGQWKIENWESKFLSQKKGLSLSLSFKMGSRPFCLNLYPCGQTGSPDDHTSIFLYNYHEQPVTLNLMIEICGKDGFKKESNSITIAPQNGKGYSELINKDKKQKYGQTLLINFKVKITSTLCTFSNK